MDSSLDEEATGEDRRPHEGRSEEVELMTTDARPASEDRRSVRGNMVAIVQGIDDDCENGIGVC